MTATIPQLSEQQKQIIGRLLVETLQGEISHPTRMAVASVRSDNVPAPYRHIMSFTQGWVLDNVELARELRGELRYICDVLMEQDSE